MEKNKIFYRTRKETIAQVFSDAKEKHGMWWTTLKRTENCPYRRCNIRFHEREENGQLVVENIKSGMKKRTA